MSSDSKKRKPKVIRTDGGPQEGKRGKADGEQVKGGRERCAERCWVRANPQHL